MSNKKQGCAARKEKDANRQRLVFNYRPFLRIIKRYRAGRIDRGSFCAAWETARCPPRLPVTEIIGNIHDNPELLRGNLKEEL
jgi:hypothetical protein